MPTCDAPGPLASKNTRSPAWMFARATGVPTLNWSKLVRGIVTPACAIAHCVSPEQSQVGPSPPSSYAAPIFDCAAPTADPPARDGADPEPPAPWVWPDTPSAPSVAGP